MRCSSAGGLIGSCLLLITAAAQPGPREGPPQQPSQIVVYQPEFKTEITRDGTTKTVEMALHPGERRKLLRQITAIKGSQFSLRRLRPGESRPLSCPATATSVSS